MKKIHIIIISIITIAIIIGAFLIGYFASLHSVGFIVKQPNLTVSVYTKSDKTKINSFTSEKFSLSLPKGGYYYTINGKNIDGGAINFNVDKSDITINIDPDYSSAYLSSLLATEQDSILSVIKNTYPAIISNYTISDAKLFKKGEWYGAIIRQVVDPRSTADQYRVILKKENGKWAMVHYPEIVVTKTNFPNVPIEILTAVNDLNFS